MIRLEADNIAVLDLKENLSLVADIYLTEPSTSEEMLVSKYQSNGDGGYALGIAANGALFMRAGAKRLRVTQSLFLSCYVSMSKLAPIVYKCMRKVYFL